MKTADRINPLTNPIIPGDLVKAGGRLFWADTTIQGKWVVFEGKQIVAHSIDSQVELCAWFQERDGGDLCRGT